MFILINQLLKTLLIFKSKHSSEMSDKFYENLFFYKMEKDINLKKFFKTLTNFYPGYPGYIFEGTGGVWLL